MRSASIVSALAISAFSNTTNLKAQTWNPFENILPPQQSSRSDPWEGFRREADAFYKCNAEKSRELAKEPVDPVALAKTARTRCSNFEIALAKAINQRVGAARANQLWDKFKKSAEEQNLSLIIRLQSSHRLAVKCDDKNNAASAIKACSEIISISPKNLSALLSRAQNYENIGNHKKAIEDYSALIELTPDEALLYKFRGLAHFELGDYESCVTDLNQAVQKSKKPDYSMYRYKGMCVEGTPNSDGALSDYSMAIQLNPRDAISYYYRAGHFADRGDNESALSDYSAAIQIEPNYILALGSRAMLFDKIGRTDEARKDFARLLILRPSSRDEAQMIEAARLYDKATPAAPKERKEKPMRTGTGFFINVSGSIITNAHVVAGCTKVQVSQPSGHTASGTVVKSDTINDLAMIKVDFPKHGYIGRVRQTIRTGEPVAAYGFPMATVLPSAGNFTVGNITATAGPGDDSRMLQFSAPIQSGSSGSPLVDNAGHLVGIVTSKLKETKSEAPQNANFAIRGAMLVSFLEANGVSIERAIDVGQELSPPDLADTIRPATVFIVCQ